MNKLIKIELSLAERLASSVVEARFCGFCRTERAAVEELKGAIAKPEATLGFGTVDECDPLDRAVLSAMMPGPAPAEDGPNRQLETYAAGRVYHPLANIAEWRKGCSCAVSQPGECLDCTNGLIEAIERWFEQVVREAICGVGPGDFRRDGDWLCLHRQFLSHLMYSTGISLRLGRPTKLMAIPEEVDKITAELDQAQATIKEMGDLIDQQAAEITRLKQNQNYLVEGCTCNRAQGIPKEEV